jgi:GAF domain-containing protein
MEREWETSRPAAPDHQIRQLEARVAELERERDHLVAIVDILQAITNASHFVEILQTIVHNLGRAFGLERCSVYLSGDQHHVRLVASYDDPAIANLIVDLNRYPELQRAFESGETVFIPDATVDPMLQSVQVMLGLRNIRSIVVVPIRWRGTVIGAIFLRTERDGPPFTDRDIRFCQVVASLTASALRQAYEKSAGGGRREAAGS